MAWSDAARKAAAAKKTVSLPVKGAAPVPNPHMNNMMASHARGYFRHKMPK